MVSLDKEKILAEVKKIKEGKKRVYKVGYESMQSLLKYKIRNYLIKRGNRDFNDYNDIKKISDKMKLGLIREI